MTNKKKGTVIPDESSELDVEKHCVPGGAD